MVLLQIKRRTCIANADQHHIFSPTSGCFHKFNLGSSAWKIRALSYSPENLHLQISSSPRPPPSSFGYVQFIAYTFSLNLMKTDTGEPISVSLLERRWHTAPLIASGNTDVVHQPSKSLGHLAHGRPSLMRMRSTRWA